MESFTSLSIPVRKANEIDPALKVQEVKLTDDYLKLIHPLRMVISGPSQSGKTTFIKNLLIYREAMFTVKFYRILLCIPSLNASAYDALFSELKQYFPNLELILDLPKPSEIRSDNLPKLLILDDLIIQIINNSFMEELFCQLSHHNSCSIIYTTQNFFSSSKTKTIIRNTNYKVLFRDRSDKLSLRNIGTQIVPEMPNFLHYCFKELEKYFPDENHRYILIDSHSLSPIQELYIRSKIFPDPKSNKTKPVCFFINNKNLKK